MKHTMTRITSLLLAVIMLFSVAVFPVAAAGNYSDVQESDWFSSAVDYVTEEGFMNGVSDSEFAPYTEVTRAMFVTVLARLAGAETEGKTAPFADVPAGSWYTGAVAWAAENGIVKGVSATRFAPERSISRQDMCTIIRRYINAMGYEFKLGEGTAFSDMDSVADYAKDAVEFCSKAGLIGGFEDGTFCPKAVTTRAQIATVMMRLDLEIKGEVVTPVPMPAQSFQSNAGDDMSVVVNAPEGALPENSDMSVSRVTDEAALAAIEDMVSGSVFAAADITFSKDGTEIEPQANVEVQIAVEGLENLENPIIVHVRNDGSLEYVDFELIALDGQSSNDPNYSVNAAGSDNKTEASNTAGKALRFYARDFSVYAVLDGSAAGDNARLFVHFKQANNAADIVIPVKKSDMKTDELYQMVLYDPGVGELTGRQTFFGWAENDSFTAATTGLSIAEVRQKVAAKLNTGVSDGETLTFYPMIFDVYTVTFLDEDGAGIKTDSVLVKSGASSTYTINQEYDPKDTDSRFEGWGVASKNSEGKWVLPENEAQMTLYDNNDTVTFGTGTGALTDDLVLRAYVPKGHWLIFKENGSGASFTPPAFYRSNNTVAPTPPTRFGYTFGGWYLPLLDADGKVQKDDNGNVILSSTAFTFGQPLEETIRVYAKWNPVQNAKYTVIIWKQNVNDAKNASDANKKYDFAEAISNLTGTVGQNVNAVSSSGSGNNAVATVNGTTYRYTGFHLNRYDTNVEVKAEGNAIVNVYYDRNLVTLTFQYRSGNSWATQTTMSGLYGSTLAGNGYTWPTNRWWYDSYSSWGGSYSGNGTRTTFLDAFLISDGSSSQTFYGFAGSGSGHLYCYKKNASGEGYTLANEVERDASATFNISDKYNGYKAVQYSTNGTTWTNLGGKDSNGYYASVTSSTIYVRYDPLLYNISYSDGVFVDGNNVAVPGYNPRGMIHEDEDIPYLSSVSSYNKGGDNYYEPSFDGFVFAGWYADSTCTQPFTFTTMPEGLNVYAKWVIKQYRVFLYPNATNENQTGVGTDDPTFESGEQSTSFRIDFREDLSFTAPRRAEYEFNGWFTDSGLSNPFSVESFTANDTTVPTTYDKTEPTERDYYGNPTSTENKDATNNRFWINRKLELYVKWRLKLIGSDGIVVIYESGDDGQFADGTKSFTDPLRYEDDGDAIAQGAATATTEGKEFKCWVLQKWDNSSKKFVPTETKVSPGKKFDVLASLAQIVGENGEYATIGNLDSSKSYTYTVKLVAEYGSIEAPKPTHVWWFSNNETGKVQEDNDIGINIGVDIPAPDEFTPTDRAGTVEPLVYKDRVFIGWARLYTLGEGEDAEYHSVNADGTDRIVEMNDKGVFELTEKDLFLKWIEPETENGTGEYQAKNKSGAWVHVDEVACDEETPYHDLYAVWAGYFYVFHSSTGKLEAIEAKSGVKTDLTALVSSDYLYGGYYSNYGPVKSGITEAQMDGWKADALAARSAANKQVATEIETYDGSKVKASSNSTRYWKYADAFKAADGAESGKSMSAPAIGTVIYLKEVPKTYLATRAVWIVDENGLADGAQPPMVNFFLLTVIDDSNYSKVGFKILNGEHNADAVLALNDDQIQAAAVSKSFTISMQQHDGSYIQKTFDGTYFSLYNTNYVAVLQDTSLINAGDFTVCCSWMTLDGVRQDNCPYAFNTTQTAVTWKPLYTGYNGTETITMNMTIEGLPGGDWWANDTEGTNPTNIIRAKFYRNGTNDFAWADFQKVEGTDNDFIVCVPAGDWDRFQVARTKPGFDKTNIWDGNNIHNYLEAVALDTSIFVKPNAHVKATYTENNNATFSIDN